MKYSLLHIYKPKWLIKTSPSSRFKISSRRLTLEQASCQVGKVHQILKQPRFVFPPVLPDMTTKACKQKQSYQHDYKLRKLRNALDYIQQKSTRAAWAWRQRDISSAWVLPLPSVANSLSNTEFTEATASTLCLLSLTCRGRPVETVKD